MTKWIEIKRYASDGDNIHFMLDGYGLEATLSLKDGEYWLYCKALDIDCVIDSDLKIAQRIGIKILMCKLLQRSEEYKLIYKLMQDLCKPINTVTQS